MPGKVHGSHPGSRGSRLTIIATAAAVLTGAALVGCGSTNQVGPPPIIKPAPAPTAAAPAVPITNANLVGVWQGGGNTLKLNKDGTYEIMGEEQGNWTLSGSNLQLSPVGDSPYETPVALRGNVLYTNGASWTRQ